MSALVKNFDLPGQQIIEILEVDKFTTMSGRSDGYGLMMSCKVVQLVQLFLIFSKNWLVIIPLEQLFILLAIFRSR